jgi:hypothetical protein
MSLKSGGPSVVAAWPFFQYRVNAVSGETFSRRKVSVGAQVIVTLEAFVEHCLLLLLGHLWKFSRLDVSQTNVFHHPSSPGGGKRRKLACSIGSPYSRQALGKSTAEPIFIFNSASRPAGNRRSGSCREICGQKICGQDLWSKICSQTGLELC